MDDWGFPGGTSGKEPTCQYRRRKRLGFDPWGREDPLEEGMATCSSILAWRIPRIPLTKSLQLGFLLTTFIYFLSHPSSPVNEGGIPSS